MPIDRFTCEQILRRLQDFIDRELSAEEMALLEDHLRHCEVCLAEYRFEKTVLDDVRAKMQQLPVPASLKSRISLALDGEESRGI